jgi:homoserine dehydrogenase
LTHRPLRIALLGFGNVGRRFAELLGGRYRAVLRRRGCEPRVTGIATARHGVAVRADGLPLPRCLARVRAGGSLDGLGDRRSPDTASEFIRTVPADVLVELTPLDPRTGQPAVRHCRLALARGLHVVTANKGPVAFALGGLRALARRRRRRFLHEGAVMDGTPIFNLMARCLPGARVLGFRGTLNSTTSRILSRMEQGVSAARALREAQAAGIAEADPRHDLEGWDAAVKGCALANALMGARLRPPQVRRRGIRGITVGAVRRAVRAGRRLRLVVRAQRTRRGVRVAVSPEALLQDDLLVASGADGVLVLETDLMGEIGLWEGPGGVDQTAYAVLSDLVTVVETAFHSAEANPRSTAFVPTRRH